jgi:hypothetical protein
VIYPDGSAAKVIDIALREVGTIEEGDNLVKYNDRNGLAWCGYFVNWCYKEAKVQIPSMISTAMGAHKMKDLGRWVTDPQVGDLAFFDFIPDATDKIQHIGIVAGVDPAFIITIEGNTAPSSGSQWNGGMVMIKQRSRKLPSSIVGFGRPKFVAYNGSAPVVTYLEEKRKKVKNGKI